MITRIVKMHFRPDEADNFEQIYLASRPVILSMKGCLDVSLHRQTGNNAVMFTISRWETEEDLNNYRQTDFFKETWSKSKALFESRAEAWSLEEMVY